MNMQLLNDYRSRKVSIYEVSVIYEYQSIGKLVPKNNINTNPIITASLIAVVAAKTAGEVFDNLDQYINDHLMKCKVFGSVTVVDSRAKIINVSFCDEVFVI